MEAIDPRIGLAIENALAASRWRIAARFEGPSTARRYKRLADTRSAAATALLREVVAAGASGGTHASHRLTRNDAIGGAERPRRV